MTEPNMLEILMKDKSEHTGKTFEIDGSRWMVVAVLGETDTHFVAACIYANADPAARITPMHAAHVAKDVLEAVVL